VFRHTNFTAKSRSEKSDLYLIFLMHVRSHRTKKRLRRPPSSKDEFYAHITSVMKGHQKIPSIADKIVP